MKRGPKDGRNQVLQRSKSTGPTSKISLTVVNICEDSSVPFHFSNTFHRKPLSSDTALFSHAGNHLDF